MSCGKWNKSQSRYDIRNFSENVQSMFQGQTARIQVCWNLCDNFSHKNFLIFYYSEAIHTWWLVTETFHIDLSVSVHVFQPKKNILQISY